MFFSAGLVLLSALSWCCARTCVSEDTFLMYPWREKYSMSTFCSAALFSLFSFVFLCCILRLCIFRFFFLLLFMFVNDFSSTGKLLKGIRDFLSGLVVKNTLASTGDTGSIPALGSQEATEPMCHNYLACTLYPTCLNYWAYMPQLLKSECSRAHVLQQEKPLQ